MTEIQKLYLSNFVYGFGVMAAFTFTLFFLANGLSSTQIGVLFSVYLILSTFLEVPTGAFADMFGHKFSFCVGLGIDACYYLTFFFSHSFLGFLLGMIIAAVGLSLESGANTSLLYEILKKEGREGDFAKVQGRISTMGLVAVAISAPLATFLYKSNHRLPYLLSFLFVLLSAVIIYFVKYEFTKSPLTLTKYLTNMKDGVVFTLKSKKFLSLVFISMSVAAIFSAYLDLVNQPFQLQIGIPVQVIGIVQAIASIGSAIAAWYAHVLLKKLGKLWSLMMAFFLPAVSLLILSQWHSISGVLFIVIFMVSQRYSGPITSSLQQEEASSAHRSTMNSVANMATALVGALLLPFWGILIDKSNHQTALLGMGIFVLFMGLVGLLLYKRLE